MLTDKCCPIQNSSGLLFSLFSFGEKYIQPLCPCLPHLLVFLHQHNKRIFTDGSADFVLIEFSGYLRQFLHPKAKLADFLLCAGEPLRIIPLQSMPEFVHNSGFIQCDSLSMGPNFSSHDLSQGTLVHPMP